METTEVTTLETQPTGKERAAKSARAGRPRPFRFHVIGAVFKRNLLSYFSNPAGYVFITLFVLISSCVAFWQDVFFTSNLANLDQLNRYMPYLLLFFVPAITMSSWADERRQGTDELLLTLPAHDLDVVLGKYLAALGIFTVALGFSLSHVWILKSLGGADYGIIFANYLGYWLMGAMLIALGMVASLLSSNVTVAFILGALFCALPVFLDWVGSPSIEFFLKNSGLRYVTSKITGASEAATAGTAGRAIENWSVPARFQDFGSGVIPLSGFCYFLGIAAAMLYLNMILLGRRHWAGGEASGGRWLHSVVRFASVILALLSLTVLIDLSGVRADTSAERLHTLSPESLELVKQIPADRPVMIQCYYSPQVPREFVETKANLLGLLREYEARSGGRIQLNLVPTELYSEEARDAEKRFGIEARKVLSTDQARQMAVDVYLGVAFVSGLEEVVIPFFDRGLPVEYEVTRSIRVVSKSGRTKLGILTTDAKMMGGFDMRAFSQSPEWPIVTELKKQYEVSSVSPDVSIPGDINVLLVAQPSSMTQKQIDNLTEYVKKGGATLLMMDPAPMFDNLATSPELPRQSPGGPFGGGPPPEPKGNLRPLLQMCGLEWPSVDIVWNAYNPHPRLASLPREIVFVGSGAEAGEFNPDQVASSGLQEIVTIFPGHLRGRSSGGASGPEFIPLLKTGRRGGTLMWTEAFQQGFMGVSGMNPRRRYSMSGESFTLAARIRGKVAADAQPADAEKKDAEKKDQKPSAELNVIAIADVDMIGEQFFQIRANKAEDLDFDNIPFVLNCVDVLAGDESFVSLRKKRPKHHTLQALEKETSQFYENLETETKVAEDEARKALDDAQKAFDAQVDQVKNNKDLDDRAKEVQLENLQAVAQRRLDVQKSIIEDQKQARIRDGRATLEQNTREIQNGVRFKAAALPPLPPLLLGLAIWFVRRTRENLGANPKRLA
jgi:ABC-2 type transport system permease protein